MDDEAGLIGEFADDFYRNGGGVPDAIAVVGAVGISARDEGMPLVRLLEQGHRAIAVLHIGRMDQYDQGATIGYDNCMAFEVHGLLAFVVTPGSGQKAERGGGKGGVGTWRSRVCTDRKNKAHN